MIRKYRILSVLAILGFCMTVRAQGVSIFEINGGYLNPKGTTSGSIFGASYGLSVDERVDISLGIAYFYKKYTKRTEVADTSYTHGLITEKTVMTELEYGTALMPVSANVLIRMPVQPPLSYFVGGAVTYNFLFNHEKNYEAGISEKRTYRGFGWLIRAGIEYSIGSRSSVLLEGIYNIGHVRRNVDETVKGLPIWDEVDITGLGVRAGLRMEFY